ncbi:unnamed protein product [Urochloa humidicola]
MRWNATPQGAAAHVFVSLKRPPTGSFNSQLVGFSARARDARPSLEADQQSPAMCAPLDDAGAIALLVVVVPLPARRGSCMRSSRPSMHSCNGIVEAF